MWYLAFAWTDGRMLGQNVSVLERVRIALMLLLAEGGSELVVCLLLVHELMDGLRLGRLAVGHQRLDRSAGVAHVAVGGRLAFADATSDSANAAHSHLDVGLLSQSGHLHVDDQARIDFLLHSHTNTKTHERNYKKRTRVRMLDGMWMWAVTL